MCLTRQWFAGFTNEWAGKQMSQDCTDRLLCSKLLTAEEPLHERRERWEPLQCAYRLENPSRRTFVRSLLAASLAMPLESLVGEEAAGTQDRLTGDHLFDEIERRGCRYFYEMGDPETGLVLDRTLIEGKYEPAVASIAATGFGLSALCIADLHGYFPRDAMKARVQKTLRYLNTHVDHERGFFYHFLESSSGRRVWKSEASSIDTSWLLCGALHCRGYWDDPEIRRLAADLLDRVEWRWMLNSKPTLCHGWTPENGFLRYRWDTYAEVLAMYLLAIGAASNGIPAQCWDAWKRPLRDYQGVFFIDDATPLFVHQYSHAWFDFRNRTDRYANYFRNSQRATQAHRLYCMQLAEKFPWYGPDMWGVTSSASPSGYRVWASASAPADGTLVPCASGGSLVFLPTLCGAVLENMIDRYSPRVWAKYGFVDAFQPQHEWYSREVIGINLGIMVLMAENARTGAVWKTIMSTPEAVRAMETVGLKLINDAQLEPL
jgi:hypothetical protein